MNEMVHVHTTHNPESVVEVYLDPQKIKVTEMKCLNYNRYKQYNYSLNEFLNTYAGKPAAMKVQEAVVTHPAFVF